MVALLTMMVPTAQRFCTYDITEVPTTHIYKLCTNAATGGLLLALTSGIREVRKRAA